MCGGCDRNPNVEALRPEESRRRARLAAPGRSAPASRVLTWAATLALLALPGVTRAQTQQVDPDGRVHRISVVSSESGGTTAGTALLHTRWLSSGEESTATVTGTDDPAPDVEPWLEIDPISGLPVVAWSRNEGPGFDIYVARFEDGTWTQPRAICPGPPHSGRPQIHFGRNLMHVVWAEGQGGSIVPVRASLDRASLETVYGPESLPLDTPTLIPPEGESVPGSPEPPTGDAFVALEGPPIHPGDPGRIIVWGIRDEPMPIEYRQGFLLPAGVSNVQNLQCDWVHGRLALWFVVGDRFRYTFRDSGKWSNLRAVLLDDSTNSAEAFIQMQEMLERIEEAAR